MAQGCRAEHGATPRGRCARIAALRAAAMALADDSHAMFAIRDYLRCDSYMSPISTRSQDVARAALHKTE